MWLHWTSQFENIKTMKVPRCYMPLNYNSLQLQFCDAREQAFGCVAYFRFQNSCGHVHISLVMSKTQVSPLKPMSIPRLELQAAVLGSRLAENIKNEHSIPITDTFLWTDSKTVLCWIRSETRTFKTFVADRVGEIHAKSDPKQWNWVSTKENPADDLTRNEKVLDLATTSRWFKGSSFLYLDQELWLNEHCNRDGDMQDVKDLEIREVLLINKEESVLPNFEKFSSWFSF